MNISGNNGLVNFRKFSFLILLLSGLHVTASAQGTQVDINSIPRSGTALVYTHQDDDLIWMLPFWNITEKFIQGAMPITPRFEEIVHDQQIYMDNHGYNIPYESNWYHPWGKIEDDEYQSYYWGGSDPDYAYIGIDHLLAYYVNAETDRKEINRIKSKIEQYIANPDVSRIITHNNWGEYGHYQHKQLNKAVRELAVKYRKDVWMLGCDNGNFVDITVPAGITYTMGWFDAVLFDAIREIYIHPNNWWTWSTTRKPSGDHKFIKIVAGGIDKSDILTGTTVTVPGPHQYKTGAYIFDGADDYLTLAGNNNTSFTIDMWIMPDEIKAMDISKMAEYPLSSKYDRALYLRSDGRVTASINDGQIRTVTSATSLSAGTWAHIIMSGNGDFLKLYVDGELEGYISAGSAISNYGSPEFVLGQAQVTSSFFMGQIADVKLFNYAMNPDDTGTIIKAPTPNYEIDFYNERTGKAVPVTDEYSYHADMSGAVSGRGQKLSLTPGTDVYFRTKASGSILASDIQMLDVPSRTSAPSFGIDYINEETDAIVTSAIGYAYNPNMTGSYVGNGHYLHLTPGTDVYFRKLATSNSFYSLVMHLVVPARPSPPDISIDYMDERTGQIIGPEIQYSTSSSYENPVSGAGSKIDLTPGQDLYFRTKATSGTFSSVVNHLIVPDRPSPPDISIDFEKERTGQIIDPGIEYSASPDCKNPVSGAGSKIDLTPGHDLYFWLKATSGSFYSLVTHLTVPERPSPPDITIDFASAGTGQIIDAGIEYSASPEYENPVCGAGSRIDLTPGQDLYFRVKANDSSFCSLATHLTVPDSPAPPAVSIDYENERTGQAVEPNVEYSDSSACTNPVSGTGNTVALTPGHDLYFRVKATSNSFYSPVTHLKVPVRPGKPAITIDYSKETSSPVYSSMAYSTDSAMGSVTFGGDTVIAVTPGTNLFFRVVAKSGSFSSDIQHLIIPKRPQTPAYTVDYKKARTVQAVSYSDIYSFSADLSDSLMGTNAPLDLLPGNDIYFRTRASDSSFCSAIQYLIVSQQPEIQGLSIDFIHEQTKEPVDTTIEYSADCIFFSSCGKGCPLELNPGEDMFFRKKATDSSFCSKIYTLDIPARPEAPQYTIDFIHEQTMEPVDTTVEYSADCNSFTSCGKGCPLELNPGENMFYRKKATDSSFCSETYTLVVHARPETPQYTIDFIHEQTLESVNSGVEFSAREDFLAPSCGAGSSVKVNPGENLYFRIKSTDSTFASISGLLEIPNRPSLLYSGEDTIGTAVFSAQAVLPSGMTGFDLSKIAVINGYAQNLKPDDCFDIVPKKRGEIQTFIIPNAFNNASFASNKVIVFFRGPENGFEETGEIEITVYPVPSKDGLIYIYFDNPGLYKLEVYSQTGSMIREKMVFAYGLETLDLNDLKGIYYLWVASDNARTSKKIVLY